MGVIQPSRFLTHTGIIRPGVRRVVPVPNSASGAEWSVAVPAGVQWYVISWNSTLVTGATVGNRQPGVSLNVDGEIVWRVQGTQNIAASFNSPVSGASDISLAQYGTGGQSSVLSIPDGNLPQDAILSSFTGGLVAGDNYAGIALWIEEYYLTDPQLSELERSKEEVVREWIHEEIQQAQTGRG